MSLKQKLQRDLLLALLQCDGTPMPENSLLEAAMIMRRVDKPTLGDAQDALKDIEAEGYATGLSEPLQERSWTLTTKGTHKARQLRS